MESILFCVTDCGLQARIASERFNSGEARLAKIVELMRECRFGIHDLSRLKANHEGEFSRLNMPFELGIDYGLSVGGQPKYESKRILVLAEQNYEYQAALSDIAGWDIATHEGDYEKAIESVRRWFASNGLTLDPPSKIVGRQIGFQEWDYERLLASDWKEDDIQKRTTHELLKAMREWVEAGRPSSFN